MLPDKEAWSLRHPHAIFTLIFLCVLFLAFIFPDIWTVFIGIQHLRWSSEVFYPFLDMMGRLAAFEGYRAGVDMLNYPNPFDPLERPNTKPSWPLHLSFLGLSLDHLILMGTMTTIGTAALVTCLLRLKRWFEVPIMLLLCLSPGVMLGIERANDDLIYLLLLSTIPLALKWKSPMRVWLVWLIVFLLAPAKFYPGVAFAVLLLEIKSWRLLSAMLSLGAFFLSTYVLLHWDELKLLANLIPRPTDFMVHGLSVFVGSTGLPEPVLFWVKGFCFTFCLVVFTSNRWPKIESEVADQRWFVLGASVWIFCYFANSNFDYRLIFFIPMFPLLLSLGRASCSRLSNLSNLWLLLLVPTFWVEILFLHAFRGPDGEWSDRYVPLALAIKNSLLLISAFFVVFVLSTLLRPHVRGLFRSFWSDLTGSVEYFSNKRKPLDPSRLNDNTARNKCVDTNKGPF